VPKAPHGDSQGGVRAARATPPVLEQLAELYPGLFGEVFLPLKRGIFQDLLAAHPDVLDREALKAGLAIHTRSTRYLQAVAAGLQRHDLAGQAVEAMAPEHVHHALLEVFRRRQGRAGEDLRPKLLQRLVKAFEASGLAREAYDERVRGRDEAANALLDEALAEAAARRARDEALLRAFESSGQPVEVFAGMYGMDPHAAARTLERARQRRAPATS
jgi:sRNA-binding protein